jgi:hypothetical protein
MRRNVLWLFAICAFSGLEALKLEPNGQYAQEAKRALQKLKNK